MLKKTKKGWRGTRRALIVLGVATVALAAALPACAPSGTSTTDDSTAVDWDQVIADNPSDPFVASYESGDNNLLVTMHKNLGNTCEDCHDEATASIVGTLDAAPESDELTVGTREFCLECHDWDKIVDSTELKGDVTIYNPEGLYNVHDNHRGDENCSSCHSMHETSTLHCVECHYMELPDGWDGFE